MPDWARSVPQYAPVSTQKAGISAENELKAGFLLANNARRTVRGPQSCRGRRNQIGEGWARAVPQYAPVST
jgi:hypothetical protein